MGAVSSGLVTITLTGINDAPVALDDTLNVEPFTFLPKAPRNTPISIPILLNDFDVDGTINNVQILTSPDPAKATISLQADPNLADFGVVTFTPATDFDGNVTFTYRIQDDLGVWSAPATVSVEVNDAPVAFDDGSSVSPIVVYWDVGNHSTAIDVLENDTDVDGTLNPASVNVSVNPLHGTIDGIESDGSIKYTPGPDPSTGLPYEGLDSFEYTVKDDDGAISEPATVTVNVVEDPFPWRNPSNGLDVNDDDFVSSIDALLIITELNLNGAHDLQPPTTGNGPPPYFDVDESNSVEGIDALIVINHLNAVANGEAAEGEFSISVDMTQSVANESVVGDSLVGPAVEVAESKVVDNGFTDMRNMRSNGLSTVRGEVLEDLLGEIAEDLMAAREDDLLVDIALEDFFG